MIRIITCFDNKVVIDESILSIPEFNDLWQEYKSIKSFQCIWALYDPESPYMNFSEDEREDIVNRDYPDDDFDRNSLVFIKCKRKAELMYFSPIRKILKGAKSAVEKLAQYFEDTAIVHGRDGNVSAVSSALVNLPKIIKGYQEAETAYKQELQRVRGQLKRAVDEDATDNWED